MDPLLQELSDPQTGNFKNSKPSFLGKQFHVFVGESRYENSLRALKEVKILFHRAGLLHRSKP